MLEVSSTIARYLENRLTRDQWGAVLVTRGPVVNEETVIEQVAVAAFDAERGYTGLAEDLVELAHADAMAYRTAGPYFVWVRRLDPDGRLLPAGERYPMRFDDCAPTPQDEIATMLLSTRDRITDGDRAAYDRERVMLDMARVTADRYDHDREWSALRFEKELGRENERVRQADERARAASEQTQSVMTMAYQHLQDAAAAATQQEERAERRAAMRREDQTRAFFYGQADLLMPSIATAVGGLLGGRKPHDNMATPAGKMIRRLLEVMTEEQKGAITQMMPPALQAGLGVIIGNNLADDLVEPQIARAMAQVTPEQATAIMRVLGPSEDEVRAGAVITEPQQIFYVLWQRRQNTAQAIGERIMTAGAPAIVQVKP